MTTTARLGVDAANYAADAVGTRLNGGYARIYSGSRPATADTDITTQVLLAEAQFSDPAFEAADGGEITAEAIAEVTCIIGGTAAWYRAVRSNGTTVEYDDTVGIALTEEQVENGDPSPGMVVSSINFAANQPLQITNLTVRLPLTDS
jgi:hypothetical protein